MLRAVFGATHGYVTLDDPEARAVALSDPRAFLRRFPAPVIVDEIQYAPELLAYLKVDVDADRRPGRFALTGSQDFALMKGVAESLAGRIAVTTLDPFSVREALGRGASSPDPDAAIEAVFGASRSGGRGTTTPAVPAPTLADFILRGGYPELRVNASVDRRLWFSSYVQTYVERDVRSAVRVGDLDAFIRFVKLAASRTGQLVNYASFGAEIGVHGATAKSWLSILVASRLVHLLPPYHKNFGKRLVKSSKLYWNDPGLAAFLLGYHDAEALVAGPSYGPLVETAVVSEWIKLFRAAGEEPPLSFWRSSGGDEVDLLVERNGRLFALEIKATETPVARHADGLAKFRAVGGAPAGSALACDVAAPHPLTGAANCVPWHLAWV